MDRPQSRRKIAPFIEQYALDPNEFARQPDEFESFNEFFFRSLKPEARPVDPDPMTVVFPADGRHLCIPDLSRSDGLLVKGEIFNLETLLADSTLAREYASGPLLVSRLCPMDYHRYHFPVARLCRTCAIDQRSANFGQPDRALSEHPHLGDEPPCIDDP